MSFLTVSCRVPSSSSTGSLYSDSVQDHNKMKQTNLLNDK